MTEKEILNEMERLSEEAKKIINKSKETNRRILSLL